MKDQRIIAVGLLTARDLEVLGQGFTRVFPIDDTPCFAELLSALDQADRSSPGRRLGGQRVDEPNITTPL